MGLQHIPREWAPPLLPKGGLALPLLDVTIGIRILGLLGQTAGEEGTEGARRGQGQKIKERRRGGDGGQRYQGEGTKPLGPPLLQTSSPNGLTRLEAMGNVKHYTPRPEKVGIYHFS